MNFGSYDQQDNIVKIKIFGVGGGGCNAVNRLVKAKVQGVSFIASNTDMMALNNCSADTKIQLGIKRTRGLGAGSKPQIGKEAAEESAEDIRGALADTNLVFITAGMGGGTGTGGAPVVAQIAREMGILTIAIVTKPFASEGRLKMQYAEAGIEELRKYTDVLLVIPNQKVFDYVKVISANKKEDGAMLKLMQIADDVLHSSIVGITNLIVKHSLINLDFADLSTVIKDKGTAHIGIGQGEGENKVVKALIQAANSPLLESNFGGATQILVSITGDIGMSALEIDEAMDMIGKVVAPDCNIIQGIGFDETLEDKAIVTIVATGFDGTATEGPVLNVSEPVKKEEKPVENSAPTVNSMPFAGNNAFASNNPFAKAFAPATAEPQPAPKVQPAENTSSDDEIPSFLRRLRERGNR